MIKKSLQTIVALCLASAAIKAQCPVASAGPDQTICLAATHTVTLNAVLPPSFTGTWSKLGGGFVPGTFTSSGTITSTTNKSTTVTGLTVPNTLSLVWTLSDGASCTGIKDTVVISIQDVPKTASAGADKTVCAGGTATMTAGAPLTGSIGFWTKLGGTNFSSTTITDPNSRTSTITGFNMTGRDSLSWTVTNAACGGSVADTIFITTNSGPTVANAGSPLQACQGDTIAIVGNTPTLGTPSWTLPTGTGAAFVPFNFTGVVNNDTALLRGGTAGGQISLAYKISYGTGASVLNGCVSVDTLKISFNPSIANAGPDQKLCASGNVKVTMAATKPAIGETGKWTFVSQKGNEVITKPTSYSTTITGITSDTLILRWTVTGGGNCTDSDDVQVFLLGGVPSHAVAGTDITACVGDTLQLIGSNPISGTPKWSRPSTDVGAFNFACFCTRFKDDFIPTNGANDSIQVALNAAGTFKLYYTISVGGATVGSCVSKDSLQIFSNDTPVANAGPDQSSCAGITTFTVVGNSQAVGTGVWSKVSGLGTLTKFDTVAVLSGMTSGTTVLAWTANNGICTSVDNVSITVGAPSTANAGLDKTACVGDTLQLIGSAVISGTPKWSTQAAGGFGTNAPPIIGNVNNDSISVGSDAVGQFGGLFGKTTPGTYNFIYTISVGANPTGACVSTDTVHVTFQDCTVGIEENLSSDLSVSVQPNPASGQFTLSLKDSQTGTADIAILSLDGRTVLAESLGDVKDVLRTINISNLSSGLYIVKVKKGEGYYTTKLLVQ